MHKFEPATQQPLIPDRGHASLPGEPAPRESTARRPAARAARERFPRHRPNLAAVLALGDDQAGLDAAGLVLSLFHGLLIQMLLAQRWPSKASACRQHRSDSVKSFRPNVSPIHRDESVVAPALGPPDGHPLARYRLVYTRHIDESTRKVGIR